MTSKHRLLLLTFTFSICSLAILATEFIILPKLFHTPRSHLLMAFAAVPGTNIDGQIINSWGFTGDVIQQEKPPNTLRILILGGSSVFNRHFAERLKQRLQQQTHKNIELVDAALRAHNSRSSLLKMQLFADYNFDYVLIYDGINDLLANHVPPDKFKADYSHMLPFYRRNFLLDHSLIARFLQVKISTIVLWKKPYFGIYDTALPTPELENASNFASINTLHNNLSDIVTIAKEHHTQPLLMTFAYHLPSENDLPESMTHSSYARWPTAQWGTPTYIQQGLQRTNAMIRHYADEQHLPLLDVDAAFTHNISLFEDVCHFNDQGVDAFTTLITNHFMAEHWL